MPLIVRTAKTVDAKPMAILVNALITRGGTTAHRQPFERHQFIDDFIRPPYGINCVVAVEGSGVVGFQAIEWADPDWPGRDKLPPGWAIVATYVAFGWQGRGIGGRLFEATLASAQATGVHRIDATIRCKNVGGLAYYERMGFVDYRQGHDVISKRLDLA
ncbi:MAG: GNAT family N-acetyltransferase [Geminicoccaceae bacterium]